MGAAGNAAAEQADLAGLQFFAMGLSTSSPAIGGLKLSRPDSRRQNSGSPIHCILGKIGN